MAAGATFAVTPESSDEARLDLDEVKVLLQQLGLDRRLITEQSAICVLALADGAERDGLLPGKKRLRDGARIHDIIEFARHECGKGWPKIPANPIASCPCSPCARKAWWCATS